MRFEQIVRFNWPYYAAAATVVAAGFAIAPSVPLTWVRLSIVTVTAIVATRSATSRRSSCRGSSTTARG